MQENLHAAKGPLSFFALDQTKAWCYFLASQVTIVVMPHFSLFALHKPHSGKCVVPHDESHLLPFVQYNDYDASYWNETSPDFVFPVK